MLASIAKIRTSLKLIAIVLRLLVFGILFGMILSLTECLSLVIERMLACRWQRQGFKGSLMGDIFGRVGFAWVSAAPRGGDGRSTWGPHSRGRTAAFNIRVAEVVWMLPGGDDRRQSVGSHQQIQCHLVHEGKSKDINLI